MMWTRRDDEMIMANANGWMTLPMLALKLGRPHVEISERARQLGVQLYHKPNARVRPNRHRKMEEPRPQDKENFTCVTGDTDPLLARLHKHHAGRGKP